MKSLNTNLYNDSVKSCHGFFSPGVKKCRERPPPPPRWQILSVLEINLLFANFFRNSKAVFTSSPNRLNCLADRQNLMALPGRILCVFFYPEPFYQCGARGSSALQKKVHPPRRRRLINYFFAASRPIVRRACFLHPPDPPHRGSIGSICNQSWALSVFLNFFNNKK